MNTCIKILFIFRYLTEWFKNPSFWRYFKRRSSKSLTFIVEQTLQRVDYDWYREFNRTSIYGVNPFFERFDIANVGHANSLIGNIRNWKPESKLWKVSCWLLFSSYYAVYCGTHCLWMNNIRSYCFSVNLEVWFEECLVKAFKWTWKWVGICF